MPLQRGQLSRLAAATAQRARAAHGCADGAPIPGGEWAASNALEAYHAFKRSVVWVVKQADAHLCDLDQKIETRIASRAKARVAGDYEAIAMEQNRLGELCIEHKARLDSMLFFWVLGGAASFAGWARAAYGRRFDETTDNGAGTGDYIDAVRSAVSTEMSYQLKSWRLLPNGDHAPSSLPEDYQRVSSSKPQQQDVPHGTVPEEIRAALDEVAFWQRCTFGVALASCALGVAAAWK